MIPKETERLILRELQLEDVEGMYTLDSNPEVHKFLGNNPITSKQQALHVIQLVRQQYIDNGIGRWTVIEKASGEFIGWSGLKFITEEENNHINYYDVGYRLIPSFWDKGYATESAKAAIKYGFEVLNTNKIIGAAHEKNTKSRRALEKCGLRFVEKFMWNDITCDWLEIHKDDWIKLNTTA